jgi:ClpP class serine protease
MWPKKTRHLALMADHPLAAVAFQLKAQAIDEAGDLAVGQVPRLTRIEITGALRGKLDFFDDFFGGASSFGQIQAAVRDADGSPADTTLLVINSPGGDFVGMGETAAVIRGASNRTAVFARTAASAAFGIVSGADVIGMAQDGMVGSLSVFVAQVDESEAARKAGVEVLVHSPDEAKGAGVPGAPIKPAARKAADELAVKLKAEFADILAAGRTDLSLADLEPLMKAQTFTADEALEAGLVDQVHDTEADFIASLFPQEAEMAEDTTTTAAPEPAAAPQEPAAAASPPQTTTEPDLGAALAAALGVVTTLGERVDSLAATVETMADKSAADTLRGRIEASGAPDVDHQLKIAMALDPELREEFLAGLARTTSAMAGFTDHMDTVHDVIGQDGESIRVNPTGGLSVPASQVDSQDAQRTAIAASFAAKAGDEGSDEYRAAFQARYTELCEEAER